jgi:hypothetical protein
MSRYLRNVYIPPGVNLYEKDNMTIFKKYNRLKKLRRILGLPYKNMIISPGVYIQEYD